MKLPVRPPSSPIVEILHTSLPTFLADLIPLIVEYKYIPIPVLWTHYCLRKSRQHLRACQLPHLRHPLYDDYDAELAALDKYKTVEHWEHVRQINAEHRLRFQRRKQLSRAMRARGITPRLTLPACVAYVHAGGGEEDIQRAVDLVHAQNFLEEETEYIHLLWAVEEQRKAIAVDLFVFENYDLPAVLAQLPAVLADGWRKRYPGMAMRQWAEEERAKGGRLQKLAYGARMDSGDERDEGEDDEDDEDEEEEDNDEDTSEEEEMDEDEDEEEDVEDEDFEDSAASYDSSDAMDSSAADEEEDHIPTTIRPPTLSDDPVTTAFLTRLLSIHAGGAATTMTVSHSPPSPPSPPAPSP